MNKILYTVAAVFVILLGSSSILVDKAAEDVRTLNTFDGIGISIHADIFYIQGNTHKIRIVGQDKDVNDLITEVKDGFLKVKFNNYRVKRPKLTLYITSKELEVVKLSGSGNFNADEPVNSDELDLAVSGSGGILFKKLVTDELEINISGSGDVELKNGKADELDIKISGSGKVLAEDFKASECSAHLSGSGSVRISATDELNARISGSGRVYYKGDPQVSSVSSGSGKVVAF